MFEVSQSFEIASYSGITLLLSIVPIYSLSELLEVWCIIWDILGNT